MSDLIHQAVMTKKRATFNFLCDTLYEEILMHDHKDELLTLMAAQVADDT